MENFIRLKQDELTNAGVIYSPATLKKWHSRGIHPEFFFQPTPKKLFLNIKNYYQWLEKEQKKRYNIHNHEIKDGK